MRDLNKFRGCLVGGAIGDALGYAIEFLSLNTIRQYFGKDGITRYHLQDGKALISDDTQMTLYTANGLLYGYTKGNLREIMGKPESYIYYSYLDWMQTQLGKSPDNKSHFEHINWLCNVPELCDRRAPGNTCMNSLRSGIMGSMEKPINNSKGCGGVMRVAPVGLYFDPDNTYMKKSEIYMLGAQVAAITHGHPLGFIPASAQTYIINRLAYENISLEYIIDDCINEMRHLFVNYNEINEFIELINKACYLAKQNIEDSIAITQLGEGWVAEETLAIAIYCCLKHNDNFEKALIAAVNHNGDSDSTGSVAGNILGTFLGYDKLPDFYKEDLECIDVILKIADDLYTG